MEKYFHILGLNKGASKEDIKESYERLSKELNPANNNNQEFFIEEYNLVQEAYEALMGKEPEEQKQADAKTINVSDIFEDSDTLLSILKKFRASDNNKKLEIIKSLEALKSNNQTYQQALSVLYKNEDIESIKSEKKETSPNLNTDNEVLDLIQKKEPITTPNNKPPKKTKKIILGTIVLLLSFFGISYLIFLKNINDFKNEIPRIVEQSKNNQTNLRKIWETQLFEKHPEIVKKHSTDGTNNGFLFEEDDRTVTTDTVISFLIYSKSIPLKLYKPNFFECVYYNTINTDNYWSHYVVGLDKNNSQDLTFPLYLEMFNKVTKKHNVSENEFEDLIVKVGGLDVFHKAKPTDTDLRCIECLKNYKINYEKNAIAINDFYDFVDIYFSHKQDIDKHNATFLNKYNDTYKRLTKDIDESLLNELKIKLEKQFFTKKINESLTFNGSREGLRNITYTFKKYNEDISILNNFVDEFLEEYYENNSLITGTTPYSYCYGRNPYCSPPYGYEECSFIDIKAPSNSDVVIIIKKNNRVYSHAYIKAGGYYKFRLGNGNFQTFFYYGNGWNPNKFIKNADCGNISGGFVKNESLDKSEIIRLYNSSMTYTLYSVEGGNFIPKTSNKDEAF